MTTNEAPPQQGESYADIEGAPPPGGGQMMPEANVVGGVYGGTVSGEPMFQPDGSMTGPLALTEGSTGHTYYDGDEFEILQGLTTEDRVRLQQQLVAVGLATNPIYGEIDDASVTAMSKLLSMSNRSGTEWTATLNRIATNPAMQEQAEKEAEFDAPTYLAPDYAALTQDVKALFRQRLGRDPDQGEMAEFQAHLDGWHKGSFDAQVGAQRQDFENRQAEGEQSGGTVRQVDPLARFREAFESKYANELDFVKDKKTAVETRETVEQGVGTLSQMSGA